MPVDKANPALAASAYMNTAKAVQGGAVSGNDGVSFADFLQQKTSQAIDTMKAGEKTSAQAVTGEADLTDVVQAVNAAELTLQTVVAIRDRLVSAYQEIMRMPI